MRGGALAALTVLAALLVLGTATASWATITAPGQQVDDVLLPPTSTGLTGAAEAPASVGAAVAAFAAVLPLALVGTADRLGTARGSRGPGTAARALATAGGVATAVLGAVATLGQFAVGTILLNELRIEPAIGLFGVGVLLVLGLTLLSWRVPRTPAVTEASRYTVEAVRGEVTPPPADDEVDEWDLAVAPEPAGPDPASEDPR